MIRLCWYLTFGPFRDALRRHAESTTLIARKIDELRQVEELPETMKRMAGEL